MDINETSYLHYRKWPTAKFLSDDQGISEDQAALILLQIKVLFPDDAIAQLLYLNEFVLVVALGNPIAYVIMMLANVSRHRKNKLGVVWQRSAV